MANPLHPDQARFRPVKRKPLIEQPNTFAPPFEVCAALEAPMVMNAHLCAGNFEPEIVGPHQKRRKGIENQLRARKMLPQGQHQRFDLRLRKVHQHALGQKEKGDGLAPAYNFPPRAVEYGAVDEMVALCLTADELAAQLDDVR